MKMELINGDCLEEMKKIPDDVFIMSDPPYNEDKIMDMSDVIREFRTLLQSTRADERKKIVEVDENTSDGFHTFKELYEFRKVYNAVLFNEWAKQGKYSVHKSTRHGDGELAFGGGWFIVMATLPSGQISNHYEMKDYYLFECEEREKADVWDGHTAHDVVLRMLALKDILAKISQV